MVTLHPSPLRVESHGSGGPPLVLVHGFGGNGGVWRKWVPRLARDRRVIVLDLMGFGRAAAPPGGDYSPLAQARHVAEVLRRLEGSRPVVVGHSIGAGIVVAATLRLQDEGGIRTPAALVLIGAAVYPQKLPPYLSWARVRGLGELFLLAPPPRFLLARGLEGIVFDPGCVDREMVDIYRAPLRSFRRRRAVLRAARQISLDDAARLSRRVPQLQMPTLLIWGEEDRIVPLRLGHRLERELPRARLVTLPGVGHLPPEEAPEEALAPLLAFLRRFPPTRDGVRVAPTDPGDAPAAPDDAGGDPREAR